MTPKNKYIWECAVRINDFYSACQDDKVTSAVLFFLWRDRLALVAKFTDGRQ